MATYTQKLKLTKPNLDELYDIEVFNKNADIIDQAIRDISPETLVRTDQDQTFTGKNEFTKSPTVPVPTEPNEAANKSYVDGAIKTSERVAKNTYVALTGDQEIDGVKTFKDSPQVPIPIEEFDATSKLYVDDLITKLQDNIALKDSTNVKLTGDQEVSGVKHFYDSPQVPTPQLTYDAANKDYVDDQIAKVVTSEGEHDAQNVKVYGDQDIYGSKKFHKAPSILDDPITIDQATNKHYVDEAIKAGDDALQAQVDSLTTASELSVKTIGDQTIDGTKTFTNLPKSEASPLADNDLTTKKYVDAEATELANRLDGEITELKEADDQNVKLTGAQDVSGVKTFKATPLITSQPTLDEEATNKKYVDDTVKGSSDELNTKLDEHITEFKSGDVTIGGTKDFTSSPHVPTPTTDDDATNKSYVDSLVNATDTDLQGQIDVLTEADTQNVKITGTQVIDGVKTFLQVPHTQVEPTHDIHLTNKAYVDKEIANLNVNLTERIDSITTDGKTFEGDLTFNGDNTFNGTSTFNDKITYEVTPEADGDLVNKKYVDDADQTTKDYVDEQIDITTSALQQYFATLSTMKKKIVSSKDECTEENYIYFVPSEKSEEENIYDEYVVIDGKLEHLGSTKVNVDNMVTTDTDQKITGTKTFEKSPVVPEPSADTDITTKKYVDDTIAASITGIDVPNLVYTDTEQTISGAKTFEKNIISEPAPTEDAHLANKKYVDDSITKTTSELTNTIDETKSTLEEKITTDIATAKTDLESQISDIPVIDESTLVKITGNQSIAGTKAFEASPTVPTPTGETDATNKAYVDEAVKNVKIDDSQFVKITEDQSIDGSKTFLQPIVNDVEPTEDTHLANKKYIDTGLKNKLEAKTATSLEEALELSQSNPNVMYYFDDEGSGGGGGGEPYDVADVYDIRELFNLNQITKATFTALQDTFESPLQVGTKLGTVTVVGGVPPFSIVSQALQIIGSADTQTFTIGNSNPLGGTGKINTTITVADSRGHNLTGVKVLVNYRIVKPFNASFQATEEEVDRNAEIGTTVGTLTMQSGTPPFEFTSESFDFEGEELSYTVKSKVTPIPSTETVTISDAEEDYEEIDIRPNTNELKAEYVDLHGEYGGPITGGVAVGKIICSGGTPPYNCEIHIGYWAFRATEDPKIFELYFPNDLSKNTIYNNLDATVTDSDGGSLTVHCPVDTRNPIKV